jgi:hypothetical protein
LSASTLRGRGSCQFAVMTTPEPLRAGLLLGDFPGERADVLEGRAVRWSAPRQIVADGVDHLLEVAPTVVGVAVRADLRSTIATLFSSPPCACRFQCAGARR